MKVFGIVAEYNPFHNGHKYQLDYIKNELDADAIVAVMSGNFVQRGEPAVLDKYTRAKMAVENGVDLVFELPVVASTASAETFARCGIALLLSTGVVTDIAFGCEKGDADLFYELASILNEEALAFRKVLQDALKNGLSFSEARAKALCEVCSEDISDFISKSNNILGIEYTRALQHFQSDVFIHPIKRTGVAHDATLSNQGEYASASFIRKRLEGNTALSDIQSFLPVNVFTGILDIARDGLIIFPNDISLFLHERLISSDDFTGIMDCSPELSNRIRNLRDDYVDFQQFSDLLHTKNMELSRIRRVLLHLVLNITDENLVVLRGCDFVPYLHILAFSKKGASLLKEIKHHKNRELFASINEWKKFKEEKDDTVRSLLKRDIHASDIYRILQTQKCRQPLPTEFTMRY